MNYQHDPQAQKYFENNKSEIINQALSRNESGDLYHTTEFNDGIQISRVMKDIEWVGYMFGDRWGQLNHKCYSWPTGLK